MKFIGGILFFFFFTHTAFSQQQFETRILSGLADGKISKYETVEIGLRIPLAQRLFREFLIDRSEGTNPYTQHNLHLQFLCNGKIYLAEPFYYEDAKADEAVNRFVTSESEWPWRIRFAVPDTGTWQCNLLEGDFLPMAIPRSTGISFQCVPGKNHGFIQVAPDHKHFQYSDGTFYFPIGENICWSDVDLLNGNKNTGGGFYDWFHWINNFADNGGNYIRIVLIQWSGGILWKENNVYDQAHAFAIDSILHIAEARGLHIHLCMDLCTGFTAGDSLDPNPIRRAHLKPGMTCADLLRDSSALVEFDRYIRYVHARWAFSSAVSTLEIIGEENRWDGFSKHENYFSAFYKHADNLLRNELDDHHLLLSTSCTNADHPSIYQNDALSFIDVHHYDNDFNCNKKRFAFIHSKKFEKFDKPFFFGEIGMIAGPGNACDPGDQEACNDISMHNALWSTLFMGGAGLGNYWWSWSKDDFRKANYPAIRSVVDSTAFSSTTKSKEWDGNGLETFYRLMENKKATYAIGWVHNESSWWGNISENCIDRNGKKMMPPKDDDKATKPEDRGGKKFIVSGLKPNQNFYIIFYDTRRPGKKSIASLDVKSNSRGAVTLEFPETCYLCSPYDDCYFEIFVDPGWRV